MLVSPARNDYSKSTRDSTSNVRTISVCDGLFPPRDKIRHDNYNRRKAQELQGWSCPRTVSYEGIDPPRLISKPPKAVSHEQSTTSTPMKVFSRISSSVTPTSRPKSGSLGQDEQLMKTQFETNIRRLQTAQQKYFKKSSDILKGVQHGYSIKDLVGKYPRRNSSRGDAFDTTGLPSGSDEEKDSNVLYDMLVDDFDDDDTEESVVSDIRDDIMSPRTITHTNVTPTATTTETYELPKDQSSEMSLIPTKLCQSAPPLNRNNLRQATLRPFTPRYSSISARLRLTRHMPFRDVLYRQLCCILWLLRAMARPDWSELISGCWNIEQWLRNESRPRPHTHHHHHRHQQQHHQPKKQHESIKVHYTKNLPSESKLNSTTHTSRENPISSLRSLSTHIDHFKKPHSNLDSSISRLPESHSDEHTGRRSILSDGSERLDLHITSTNIDSDLNESVSSKSNQGEAPDHHIDSIHQTHTLRSTAAPSAVLTANTSRTSVSTNPGLSTARGMSGRLTSITERRRSPDVLLKQWLKSQKIRTKHPDENIPLTDTQIRLLKVGDNDDLKRIFGLDNAADINKEHIRERQTRDSERKLVTNVKRRPMTSVGATQSKRHAQILHKIKRDFNDFTEEQSIILNNKLEQVDKERLFYCQTKLRELQHNMLPLTILDRLLKQLRYDENKQKMNAAYLKYQSWYVDLLQMVQPDYSDDHIIILLLKEMEEFADPSEKPTVIRFKAVLSDLKSHEICHPDVMAAIEFIRIHVIRMGNEEFDKFFCRQFPTVSRYIATEPETTNTEDNRQEAKSVA